MKPGPLVALAVIFGALAFGARAFVTNLTPYLPFAEARQRDGNVQVMGKLDKGSVVYADGVLRFTLLDGKGDKMPVRFPRAKPSNFDQAIEVTAIGRWNGTAFEANNLLVKCPSKYQGAETKSYTAQPG